MLHQPIETLSKGFKRRVGVAQALVHDPKVLIMDEPTDGLDPNQKHQVRQLINSLTADKIVVISTHILEEVTAVCTRAMIISAGKLIVDETPDELLTRSRYYNAVSMIADDPQIATDLQSLEAVKSVELNERLYAFPAGSEPLYPIIEELIQTRKVPVKDLRMETGRLDEVFRELTKGGDLMTPALVVFKRELSSYFATPIAYVFIVIFLTMSTAMPFLSGKPVRTRAGEPVLVLCVSPVDIFVS